MQIVINIDQRFSRLLKRGLLCGGVPAFMLGATLVYADVTVPNSFAKGDGLSAKSMNDNFSALRDGINAVLPAGVVVSYASNVNCNPDTPDAKCPSAKKIPPVGWLFCNGDTVSRTKYAALFGSISIAHGAGDGVNTFNLPDYRGTFLRGVDHGAGRDPDASSRPAASSGGQAGDNAGSIQQDSFASHNHGGSVSLEDANVTLQDPGHRHPAIFVASGGGDYFTVNNAFTTSSSNTFAYGGKATTGITLSQSAHTHTVTGDGGSETRPKNAYVDYIIKY